MSGQYGAGEEPFDLNALVGQLAQAGWRERERAESFRGIPNIDWDTQLDWQKHIEYEVVRGILAELKRLGLFSVPTSSPVVPAPTETEWQDWPSLDAIPADVRTVWDKAGDEYRRTNGGWKFRSHGGKWQQITLPLDDYIDYAPFTTAPVAIWDPELGTRNDWTLNEGTEQ